MKRATRTMAAVGALVASMVVAGCGGDSAESSGCEFGPTDDAAWSKKLDQALDEGKVTFYNVLAPEQVERVSKAFGEVCGGVDVVPTQGASDLLAKVDAQIESGADGADVFLWGDSLWFEENQQHLMKLTGPSSTAFPDKSWIVKGKAVNSLTIPLGFLVWNTDEFPDGFDEFSDLTDSDLAGRIGTREDLTASYVGFLDSMEKNYGEQYLQDLGAQDLRFYPSVFPLAQAVASGEIGVTNISTAAVVKELQAEGAPIDMAIPDDAWVVPLPAGVLKESKRPAAAEVFMEFLLSEDGQEALGGDGYGDSALDAPGELDLSGTRVFDAAKLTDQTKAAWESKFDDYFR